MTEITNSNLETPPPSHIITLGNTPTLDLSNLTSDGRAAIQKMHAENMVKLNHKALELGVEAQAMETHLRHLSEATIDANRNEYAYTATRVQNDSLGRTEIIMGNTETAAKGKLTRSQAGQKDLTIVYIIVAAIVAIVVAIAIRK